MRFWKTILLLYTGRRTAVVICTSDGTKTVRARLRPRPRQWKYCLEAPQDEASHHWLVPLRRRAAVSCVRSDAGHRETLQVITSTLQCCQLTARHCQVHHPVIAERNERQMRWHLRRVVVAVWEQRWFLEVQVRHIASTCRTTSATVEPTQSLLSVYW